MEVIQMQILLEYDWRKIRSDIVCIISAIGIPAHLYLQDTQAILNSDESLDCVLDALII